jgi:beta-N-acetylhexosaminidase
VSDLERLALGTLLPSFHGPDVPDWVRRRIDDGLGGVVLFADNVPLGSELDGVLVAIDEEGGDVTRLGVPTPGNLALGVLDDVGLTEEVAAEIARECASAGVNVNLAPVADVNVDDQNAAIGVRSFGADVDLVSRHTAAYVRGTQREGVAACAKHFPGHGHTREDSHKELPTLDLELAEPLRPFVAAIEAGVAAIMTAHIRVPALDDAPTTLSRAVLHGLLRDELGFDGVVITDALEMGAISNTFGREEAAVRALAAGADALCLGTSYGEREVDAVRDAIVGAVRSGELAEARLAEAAGRVVELASRFPVRRGEALGERPGSEAARRALRSEGDPLLAEPATIVEFRPDPLVAAGEQRFGLGDALRTRRSVVEVVRAERSGSAPLGPALRGVARAENNRAPLVLVLKDAHRHAWQRAAAEELLARRPDAVVVETGLPVWRPPHSGAYVVTHGAGRVNLEAAAEALAPAREPVLAKEA